MPISNTTSRWGSNNKALKRDEIKNVRDRVKSGYKKADCCEICDAEENLDFHHYYSLTALWNKWKRINKIIVKSPEDMLEFGTQFIENHKNYIYDETVTLCHYHHHERLHKIYGKSPTLATAKKQIRWVGIQREKFLNEEKV